MQLKYWFVLVLIPLVILVLYWSRAIITPFVISFFVAYALNPLVDIIERKGARRDYAILTVYLALAILVVLTVVKIVPRLVADLSQLSKILPTLLSKIRRVGMDLDKLAFYRFIPFDIKIITSELVNQGEVLTRKFFIQFAEGIIGIFSHSLSLGLIPLLSYYMSRDYPRVKKKAFRWLLQNFGVHWTKTFLKIDSIFRLYIRGQLFVTVIVGILISIGLSLMGFDTAFFLGVVAGAFNLIPYFGPVLGALPALFLGLLKSPWYVLYVILLFIGVNQIEVMFLTPRIIGGTLGLHPITVVYLVLIGGKIFGVIGMIFAVPLGALILILIQSVYKICFGQAYRTTARKKLKLTEEKLD